ncbi:unnamed protein product [Thelazia callipaeda]|uniref:GLPGLI family protein n=1 Tax=Thelazia callipaeda TaxID=103827 RepID=A0A0N5D3C6_THECL|nr:unnamed protein product [Thelazia callipaeda]
MFKIRVILSVIIFSTTVRAMHDHRQQDIIRENYLTFAAHYTADQLYKAHRAQVNELLGTRLIQSLIDNLDFKKMSLNSSIRDITSHLDSQFAKYRYLLLETKRYISSNSQSGSVTFRDYGYMMECSRMIPDHLSYEEQFGTQVNMTSACLITTRQPIKSLYYAEKNLTSVLRTNALDSAIRWQYVIGNSGPHVEYPAHAFPVHKHRHWGPFLASALSSKRRVVILIDAGIIMFKIYQLSSRFKIDVVFSLLWKKLIPFYLFNSDFFLQRS